MEKKDWRKTEPIGELTCSSFDCEKDLHCFRRQRPKEQSYRNGVCFNCGTDPIDWERLDAKNINDVDYTFKSLNYEMLRNYYWTINIDEKAINGAKKNGLEGLENWTIKRINQVLSKPYKELFRDGTQTPKNGNIIFYAQHATGCCCRKCLEEWHGINRNKLLNESEKKYIKDIIMLYIKIRLPDITKSGDA